MESYTNKNYVELSVKNVDFESIRICLELTIFHCLSKSEHRFGCSNSQGCGAKSQISVSNFRHPEFLVPVPAPASRSFWLLLQNDLVHWKRKTIVLFVQLSCPTN